jgi:hypothetical protein
MRLAMGLGFLYAKDSYQGATEVISGGGMAMSLAFGGVVAPNLVIFGELSETSAFNPTYELTGQSSQTLDSTNVNLMGIGPGIAYYLEPLNLFFSGTLTLAQVTASDSSDSSNTSGDVTDYGFGASLMIGKEWWVSTNWGIGASTMLHFASMKVNGYDARMNATGLSVLFSATYN